MANDFYKFVNSIGQSFRKRNYKLYRKMVDNKCIHKIISILFKNATTKINTPEGQIVFVNPIYHGQFLSGDSIADYEPGIRKLLNEMTKPDMVAYDVGANIGIFSLLLAQIVGQNGHVYAFEPEDNNLKCLRKAKIFNRLDNLSIESVCVADKSGVQYFDHRGGAFSGRLVDGKEAVSSHQVTKMTTVSLDDFISDNHRPPGLIKIDVEGHENGVIEGMQRCLERIKPIILCELHHDLNENVERLYSILSKKGYKCINLDDWINHKMDALESFNGVHHFIAIAKMK